VRAGPLSRLRLMARRAASAVGLAVPASRQSPIQQYLNGGRVPWSDGYSKYKNAFIASALADSTLLDRFERSEALPPGYAPRLDERVVEYPWVLSRLRERPGAILDAGSTFATRLVLDLPWMQHRTVVIYTLATDVVVHSAGVQWVYGDLRTLAIRDASVETVVCISTLEHVGMAQSFAYSAARPYPDARPDDCLPALREMRRILRPGGRLLLTIPYGQREDHGWLQQFDAAGIRRLANAFGGDVAAEDYYAYDLNGWQRSTGGACASARYFNIHATPEIEPDGAAAARAVCCLEMVRP
jgi:SAM-dependent methyltransferase